MVGRPLQIKEKARQIKGSVWMCDDFPLPVASAVQLLRLLATTGQSLEKVERFIDSALPPGFPVKIEIPVAMTVSVRIVFSNVSLEPQHSSTFEMPSNATFAGGLDEEEEDSSVESPIEHVTEPEPD